MGVKEDLVEVNNNISAKQKKLSTIFKEAGDDIDLSKVKSVEGDKDTVLNTVRKLNTELADLRSQADEKSQLLQAQKEAKGYETPEVPSGGSQQTESRKSIGERFTESAAYKNRSGGSGPEAKLDVDLKTLFQTSAGWEPESTRTGRVALTPTRPIQLLDVIPMGQTGQNAVKYMEEQTFTNAATEIDEAGEYPEATLSLEEVSRSVRKIAVFLPTTDEQLEDEAEAQSYIDNRLRLMLDQRLDGQLINGDDDASPEQVLGIRNVTGVNTQEWTPSDAQSLIDNAYKAIRKVQATGFAFPDLFLFHPQDWELIKLAKDSDNRYLFGHPSETGPQTIWGVNASVNFALPQGTAAVGAWRDYSQLFMRRGIEMKISDSHSDFFRNGKIAIRASVRAAMTWYRPSAFTVMTEAAT